MVCNLPCLAQAIFELASISGVMLAYW